MIQDEYTALILASMYGHLSVVEYLIQQGAAINTQDKEGIIIIVIYDLDCILLGCSDVLG